MLAAQRYYFFFVIIFLVVISLTFSHFAPAVREHLGPDFIKAPPRTPYRNSNPTLRDTITSLYQAIKVDPTRSRYRAPDGKWFDGGKALWTEPLGKRILVVDIDTRVPTGDNQILNPTLMDFAHMEPSGGGLLSNAIINHYLYAMIHGYDYKYYQAQHIPGHYDTWIRPHIFRELLPSYDFVVAMDADAIVSNLEVPFEWMFNRWGIQNHTCMALPWDTEEFRGENSVSISRDSKGLRVLNAGFVVAHNTPLTLELLEAWRDCTTEQRYPGCGEWKEKWSHEQRAFSEYIRYDFNRTAETIVSIPCDDAAGYPDFQKINEKDGEGLSDCNGNFVRHYTLEKQRVKEAGAIVITQSLVDLLQKDLLKKQDDIRYKEPASKKSPLNVTPSQDKHVPDHVDQEKVEAKQSEMKKQQEENTEKQTGAQEEEAAPVIVEDMVSESMKARV